MPPAFVRALASLKFTVGLLVVIAVVLSFGTILESLRGTAAAHAVYDAPWFEVLLGVFALNVLAALWERWPRNRWRVGFVITHASMLVILAGALVTAAEAVNGRLALWEGESAREFSRETRSGEARATLPFAVRLDAFEMDRYPGTDRPATYRSRITVTDAGGRSTPAVIEMNHPFTHGGWRFFQSSYEHGEGREMSVLQVSRDPGQGIVFLGYGLLLLGMLVVLVTRIFQFREAARAHAARAAVTAVLPAIAIVALLAAAAPRAAAAPQLPPGSALETLRRLPVQYDGREMPFDTQAREAVFTVTGARRWRGIDPVALAMGWTLDSQGWISEPVVKIDPAVAAIVGLAPGTSHASYRTLLSSPELVAAVGPALDRQAAERRPAPGDKPLLKMAERVEVLHAFLSGNAIRAIPGADRAVTWNVPPYGNELRTWTELERRGRPFAPRFYPSRPAIEREILYNAVRTPLLAWLLLLPAAIAAGLTLERDRWKLRAVAGTGTVLGFAVMTWGIAMRWQIAGHIPASNMYESMLFLGWGVGLLGVISLVVRSRMLVYNAAAMSALVMLLLDRLPMDPFVHPIAPVLSGTPWLAIHVPIIMVSYATFAIATFLAHLQLGARVLAPGRPELGEKWSQLLYWYLLAGSILLIAGIITGSIWAASSWGRYWGWDAKEVWSLVAFLAYMAILHARSEGLMGAFGVAMWSIGAFWTILMTYLGVNFVLGSGMHAYGAGSGNLVAVMGTIAALEAAFLAIAWRAHGSIVAPVLGDEQPGA